MQMMIFFHQSSLYSGYIPNYIKIEGILDDMNLSRLL